MGLGCRVSGSYSEVPMLLYVGQGGSCNLCLSTTYPHREPHRDAFHRVVVNAGRLEFSVPC